MGTAGPLKLVEKLLLSSGHDYFYCINADMICDFPLRESTDFFVDMKNKDSNILGLLMTTKVEDPTRYGVILRDGA